MTHEQAVKTRYQVAEVLCNIISAAGFTIFLLTLAGISFLTSHPAEVSLLLMCCGLTSIIQAFLPRTLIPPTLMPYKKILPIADILGGLVMIAAPFMFLT